MSCEVKTFWHVFGGIPRLPCLGVAEATFGLSREAEAKMTWIMVDVESDGPIPGDYSMVCLGAIVVEPNLDRTFYGQLKPISDRFVPEALAVSGFTREQTLAFDDAKPVMTAFRNWVQENSKGRPFFISDNNGFDWQFVSWYFHHFLGDNPFGHSSTNLGSLYKGVAKDMFVNFKHLRKTAHTHNPVDDARGNAEALLEMKEKMGLNISLS
jgi:DNA polymerase III epsilon subunit-like protein